MENTALTAITKDGRGEATLRVESVAPRYIRVFVNAGYVSGWEQKRIGWDITFRDGNNTRVSYRGNADFLWEDGYRIDGHGHREYTGAVCIYKAGDVVTLKGTFERTSIADIHMTRPAPSKGR